MQYNSLKTGGLFQQAASAIGGKYKLEKIGAEKGRSLVAARNSTRFTQWLLGDTISGSVSSDPKAATTDGDMPNLLAAYFLSVGETQSGDLADRLVANGNDLNIQTPGKDNTLITLVRAGKPDLVRLLIDRKVNLQGRGYNGDTALTAAIEYGYLDIAKSIFDAGATFDLDPKSSDDKFCWATYRKFLGDKQLVDGNTNEAIASYSSALQLLILLRPEYAKNAKDAFNTAQQRLATEQAWKEVGAVMLISIAGAAQGLQPRQGNFQARANYQTYALSHSKTIGQYESAMNNYRPSPLAQQPMGSGPRPSIALTGAPSSKGLRLLQQAEVLHRKSVACEDLIAEIQKTVGQ